MNLGATDKRIHIRRDGHDMNNSDVIGIVGLFIAIFGIFATLFSGWLIHRIQKRQVERLGARADERFTGDFEAGVDHDSPPHRSTSASIIPPQGIELPPKALLRTTTADRARSSEPLASMSTTPWENRAPVFQQTVNTDNSSSESIGRVEPIVGQYYITRKA